MEQSEGFVLLANKKRKKKRKKRKKKEVFNLIKSLYGLKQASKQWHENFDYVILFDVFTLKWSPQMYTF